MFIFFVPQIIRQFFKRFKVTYVAITKIIVDSWMVIRCARVDGFFYCFFLFCSAFFSPSTKPKSKCKLKSDEEDKEEFPR